MSTPNTGRIEQRIREIIMTQAGIPDPIRETLVERLTRAVETAFLPEERAEGVTVMTEAASLAADHHLKQRNALGGKAGEVGSPDSAKPKTL